MKKNHSLGSFSFSGNVGKNNLFIDREVFWCSDMQPLLRLFRNNCTFNFNSVKSLQSKLQKHQTLLQNIEGEELWGKNRIYWSVFEIHFTFILLLSSLKSMSEGFPLEKQTISTTPIPISGLCLGDTQSNFCKIVLHCPVHLWIDNKKVS